MMFVFFGHGCMQLAVVIAFTVIGADIVCTIVVNICWQALDKIA